MTLSPNANLGLAAVEFGEGARGLHLSVTDLGGARPVPEVWPVLLDTLPLGSVRMHWALALSQGQTCALGRQGHPVWTPRTCQVE